MAYDILCKRLDLEKSEVLYRFDAFDPKDWTIVRGMPEWRIERNRIVGGSPVTVRFLAAQSEETVEEYLDEEYLMDLSYDRIEAYVERYDVDPDLPQTFYDEEGNEYTREEYEEYLKSQGEL